jgi:hypothetical protein
MIQLELETTLGKVLLEENGYLGAHAPYYEPLKLVGGLINLVA